MYDMTSMLPGGWSWLDVGRLAMYEMEAEPWPECCDGNKRTDGRIDGQTDKQTDRQTDGRTAIQTGKWTDE